MRRPRGTGRIYQPKESSVWWIKFYRNGQPFRESTGTTGKRKATRVLSQRLVEVATGKFLGPNIERIGVKELAEDFLRDYRINGKSSLDDAEARWRLHLLPFFGSLRASQVTSSLLNAYVDKRQEAGARNATINRELTALKRMFNLGRKATPPKGHGRSPRLWRGGSSRLTFAVVHPRNSRREPTKAHVKEKPDGPS